jgi:hypothetical protein
MAYRMQRDAPVTLSSALQVDCDNVGGLPLLLAELLKLFVHLTTWLLGWYWTAGKCCFSHKSTTTITTMKLFKDSCQTPEGQAREKDGNTRYENLHMHTRRRNYVARHRTEGQAGGREARLPSACCSAGRRNVPAPRPRCAKHSPPVYAPNILRAARGKDVG